MAYEDFRRQQSDRLLGVVRAFDWELVEERNPEGEIIVVLRKKIPESISKESVPAAGPVS